MFGWPDAPALRAYGVPPYPLERADRSAYRWDGEALTLRFALRVLVHQPDEFVRYTVLSLLNFIVPHTGPPSVIGWDHDRLIGELHNPHWEQESIPHTTGYYSTGAGHARQGVAALDAYARVTKLEGMPTAALLALAPFGWARTRGATRRACGLFGGAAWWGSVARVQMRPSQGPSR